MFVRRLCPENPLVAQSKRRVRVYGRVVEGRGLTTLSPNFAAQNLVESCAGGRVPPSLHCGLEQLLAVSWPSHPIVVDSLSEVLTLLCYDDECLLVLIEGANLFALRWDVKFLESTVAHTLPVEKSLEESKDARTPSQTYLFANHLPFLLSLVLFLLHNGGVCFLCIGLARRVRHVYPKHVDGVVVRGRCNEA